MATEIKTSKPHVIEISGRKKATITGVLEVIGVQDTGITLDTTEGGLILSGRGIRVSRFNREEGYLSLDGEFTAIRYTEKQSSQGSFLGKIFK